MPMPELKEYLEFFRTEGEDDPEAEYLAELRATVFKQAIEAIYEILVRHWDPESDDELNSQISAISKMGIAAVIPGDNDCCYIVLPDGDDFSIAPTLLYKPDGNESRCYLIQSAFVIYVKKHRGMEVLDAEMENGNTIAIDGIRGPNINPDFLTSYNDPVAMDECIFRTPVHFTPMRTPVARGADTEAEAERLTAENDYLDFTLEVGERHASAARTH